MSSFASLFLLFVVWAVQAVQDQLYGAVDVEHIENLLAQGLYDAHLLQQLLAVFGSYIGRSEAPARKQHTEVCCGRMLRFCAFVLAHS